MTVSIGKKYVTRNGEYDAKVVSTRNADCYRKGELPVSAELKHKLSGEVTTIQYTFNGQFLSYDTHPLDLIEVPEEKPGEKPGEKPEVLVSKKWQDRTRTGADYKIYATDQGGKFPIHGAIKDTSDGAWKSMSWRSDGRSMCTNHYFFDLIEVPEEKPEVLVSKKWQDRLLGGYEYVIHNTDMGGTYPIHGAIKDEFGEWKLASWTSNGLYTKNSYTNPKNLVEVPEDTQDGWVNFDVENDEVPFLHMHDMIEVKWRNNYKSSAILAGSVDFNSSRDPVTAYRLVKKAEQPEEKPVLTLDEYKEAFDKAWSHRGTYREGIKVILKLAGVKV